MPRELPRWFLEAMKLHLEVEESRASGERVDVRKVETQASNEAHVAEARSLGACRLQSLSPSSLKSLLHRTLSSEYLEHTPLHGRQRRFTNSQSRERKYFPLIVMLFLSFCFNLDFFHYRIAGSERRKQTFSGYALPTTTGWMFRTCAKNFLRIYLPYFGTIALWCSHYE